jgi:hypothetical protein
MGGGNLLSFLSQLAYNSGILSKFAIVRRSFIGDKDNQKKADLGIFP